jgi:hypothetical protein
MSKPLDKDASDPASSAIEFLLLTVIIRASVSVLLELCPVVAILLHPIDGDDIPLGTGDSDMRLGTTERCPQGFLSCLKAVLPFFEGAGLL